MVERRHGGADDCYWLNWFGANADNNNNDCVFVAVVVVVVVRADYDIDGGGGGGGLVQTIYYYFVCYYLMHAPMHSVWKWLAPVRLQRRHRVRMMNRTQPSNVKWHHRCDNNPKIHLK